MTALRSIFITALFQDFYEEILRQKERALRESESGTVPLDSEVDETTPIEDESETEEFLDEEAFEAPQNGIPVFEASKVEKSVELCHSIQRKLRLFLEEQSLKASYQLGEYAQSNFREAEYLMAALADEVFLNLHWSGQKQWRKHLLETQLFHTQVAGELFFSRLEVLLDAADPTRNELAQVYLLCLSLGFQGKYKDLDDGGKIDFCKKRLFHLIHQRESDLYTSGRKSLTNAPYEHNIALSLSKGLPDVRTWVITFAGIACIYLFVTSILWYRLVRDLDESLQYIFEQARSLPL